MRNYTANSPTRLLSPWALLLIVVLLGALLVLTYTGEDALMPGEEQPDAVSISYAELLLQAHPDNTSLRLKLIKQLIELGDLRRARSHVYQLPESEAHRVRFLLSELAVLEAQADPQSLTLQARAALQDQMRAVDRNSISTDELIRYARYALSLTDPGLAAPAYRDLTARDGERRDYWLNEAAQAHLGAGEVLAAAGLFNELLSNAETTADQRRYLQQAFSALLSGDRSEQAAELVHRHLSLMNAGDGALMGAAVQAGIGSHRYDLATDLMTSWRKLQPDDLAALKAEFGLHLAAGELEQAWDVGQRLATAESSDTGLLKQLAQLGEWTGHTVAALNFWLRLIQLEDNPSIREHAWRLAAQLFDFDNTIALLAGTGAGRQLTDVELDTLVYSHSERGTPEQAEQWLRNYLRLQPGHQLAWMRLRQILEQTQQLAAESVIWAAIEHRFGLTIDQRVDWAEVEWQLFNPQSAWQVLNSIETDSVADEAYWRLRGELAWELERDADALESYLRLGVLSVTPDSTTEERLITLYERSSPERALDVMIASWKRRPTPAILSRALQMAMQLGDMTRLDVLIREGRMLPSSDSISALWSARALQASEAGDSKEAERLYLEALARFPETGEFRPQLLWHYIDQGQQAPLVPLLRQWEGLAIKRSALWLPFANANLLLNRSNQALRWFYLYLRLNPDDSLVQAAYADALESAGYSDRALRLRRHVLRNLEMPTHGADPAQYQIYLRLMSARGAGLAANALALRWRDGSRSMLQLWFDQFSEQLDTLNQSSLKGQWLAWARRNELKISRYAELQEALQVNNRLVLERLLADEGLDPAQRVEALQRLGSNGQAMAESLAALSPKPPVIVRQQLLRQALALQELNPQGIQVGMRRQDFGSVKLQGPTALVARQLDNDWHASLSLSRLDYSGSGLLNAQPGVEQAAELDLTRTLDKGSLTIALDTSDHDEGDRFGFGISRRLQLTSKDALEFHADWQRQAEESGLLRALGQRDGFGVSGAHVISARDQFSWSLAHQRYSLLDGKAVGSGQQANFELSHAVFFEGPAWTLRSGLSYSKYQLKNDQLPDDTDSATDESLLTPAALLQERFGQLYVGSTWRRGFPGALNRGTAQFSWLLDVQAGWQWTEQQTNYAITTGVGMEVLGDDELAFTFGYQSAPRNGDGEPGGALGVTYSARFGR
ncbi:tetratricopeptide repeat protein [Pseudomonas sp. 9Ag]|uniref:tetratricopeptide repeat protein n=1 Tax=Pseudomonas sp. 9Ag TaxID=2653167 RepID=UPI0012F0521A|nr:tetratricopeptide repeat protein [Pseudomonas sp. 9Ag]VXC07151.1 Biofilm formation protein PelB [Pseudomonas sp. 9Ag]